MYDAPLRTAKARSTRFRRTRASAWLVGTEDSGSTSWPTNRCGAAFSLAISCSRCPAVSAPPSTLRPCPRLIGRTTIRSRLASTWLSDASSPHHQVSTDGSRSGSPSRRSHSSGRNGSSAGFSSTPEPTVLTTLTVPCRTHSSSPVTPSREPGRSSSASIQVESTRRRITSTCSSLPSVRIHTRPSRTVRSLPSSSGKPSREATKAWSKAVSECVPGLSTTTRGSSTDARRRVDQGQPHGGEEGGQPVEVGGVVDLGQHPGHHPTVLHRETGPGRGLGAVGDHLPLAGRVPAEVGGGHHQAPPGHRLDTDHGAQVLVVVQHRRRRDEPDEPAADAAP